MDALHKLLTRQLFKLGLSSEQIPESLELWQQFLHRVDQGYKEADQERYLGERSIELSSKEMMYLNEQLEYAQQIAGMGYWYYDYSLEKIIWSKGLYRLLDVQQKNNIFNLHEFLTLAHPDDYYELQQNFEQSLTHLKDFECNARLMNHLHDYAWYKIIGRGNQVNKHLYGVIININSQKEYEKQITELHTQLLDSARSAGMAEVATFILHNIGNILNSTNVSTNLLLENMTQNRQERLDKIMQMIVENKNNLSDYFENDSKGKLIPEYLCELSKALATDHRLNLSEIENLQKNMDHIADIIAMQQSLSGVSRVLEKVYVPELLDNSINMIFGSKNNDAIHIVKEYSPIPFILTDKAKLLQILMNLMQNSKDALVINPEQRKVIKIQIAMMNKETLGITIVDNGCGISPEHMDQIFVFGFTTKKNGHGFGLHGAALSAKELGGALLAESEGINKGSKFTLTLPLALENLSGNPK